MIIEDEMPSVRSVKVVTCEFYDQYRGAFIIEGGIYTKRYENHMNSKYGNQ
jgi:hypothetical protein